jgi:cephalosporin hydroxylase
VDTDSVGVAGRRGVLRGARQAWSEGGVALLATRTRRRGFEALHQAKDVVAAVGAARAVRRSQPSTLDEAIEFVSSFEYAGITLRPQQVSSELRSLLDLLERERPRFVLEIGTGRGGTLFLFADVAQADAVLVSVDAAKQRGRLYRALGRPGQRAVFLGGDSHSPQLRQQVGHALRGRAVDFLFIDGDHTRAGVQADFDMYSPLVRKGGLVAFHDIVPGPAEYVGGVPEFWRDVRDDDSLELVENWDQGGCGIGVLRL